MSNGNLQPVFAAELASNVYLVKDEHTRRGFNLKYKKVFQMEESKLVTGKTGGFLVVKKPHVMAFLAKGIGEYEGQAFVAIKGTASLYDALTDLNAGVKSSHTGFSVHQGFFYAFDSILNDLRSFLSELSGVHILHCVGHSLGGALATLAADWIKGTRAAPRVNLYTFGSPRVGLPPFARSCTSRLNQSNIFRVYHKTDPVPMVPTWPFTHVPDSDKDYLLYSPTGGVPWEYHFMEHYIESAKKSGTWGLMERARPVKYIDAVIEKWLKSDGVL